MQCMLLGALLHVHLEKSEALHLNLPNRFNVGTVSLNKARKICGIISDGLRRLELAILLP